MAGWGTNPPTTLDDTNYGSLRALADYSDNRVGAKIVFTDVPVGTYYVVETGAEVKGLTLTKKLNDNMINTTGMAEDSNQYRNAFKAGQVEVKADGTPSNVLRYRLDAACDYLKGHPGSMAIVSGGQGLNEPISEASCMATYLRERGIDPGRIQLEDESRTTVENLRFCSRILREQGFDPATVRVGIVTNDFHLYRACRIARRQGLAGAVGIGAYSTPSTCPTTCCANARA